MKRPDLDGYKRKLTLGYTLPACDARDLFAYARHLEADNKRLRE